MVDSLSSRERSWGQQPQKGGALYIVVSYSLCINTIVTYLLYSIHMLPHNFPGTFPPPLLSGTSLLLMSIYLYGSGRGIYQYQNSRRYSEILLKLNVSEPQVGPERLGQKMLRDYLAFSAQQQAMEKKETKTLGLFNDSL